MLTLSYDKIIHYNDLPLCSAVGIHDLALEEAKNVKARFDPRILFKKL